MLRGIFLWASVVITLFRFGPLAWGANYRDPATGMEFVLVKGGCFQTGDIFGNGYPDKSPVHKVCVNDFYIGKYEVTQAQWKAVMGNNPSSFKSCGDNCPVEAVSWDEAKEFLEQLGKKTGKKYRLPLESEWEYAARSGGKKEKWSGTSDKSKLGDYAWYEGNSDGRTHPVGMKKPNGLGIYDMSGNVWEWMEDKHYENFNKRPGSNLEVPGKWEYCVLRGGDWSGSPEDLRFVARNVSRAIETDLTIGFRAAFPAR